MKTELKIEQNEIKNKSGLVKEELVNESPTILSDDSLTETEDNSPN